MLINDIFLNKNINTFVSFNDKSLHSWNPETMELVSHINFNDAEIGANSSQHISQIQCLCYSPKYYLYFACSKDFKLFVFNEHLNLIYQQRMPVGLVQIIYFNEAEDQLFVAGKEGTYILDLKIKFKYKPRMAIMLDPKGQSISVSIKRDLSLEAAQGQEEETGKKSAGLRNGPDDLALLGEEQQTHQNDNLPANCSAYYGSHLRQQQGIGEWGEGMKVFES